MFTRLFPGKMCTSNGLSIQKRQILSTILRHRREVRKGNKNSYGVDDLLSFKKHSFMDKNHKQECFIHCLVVIMKAGGYHFFKTVG